MEEVAKSDVFFFVTTLCVVVVTVVVVFVIAYSIRIITDVKYIVKKAKDETDEIVRDIRDAREIVKEKTRSFGTFLSVFKIFTDKKSGKKKQDRD